MPKYDIHKIAKEDAILKAMVSDLAGSFMEIIFPISYLPELINTGIAYDGSSFQGINNINHSDAILKGAEDTLAKCHSSITDLEDKNEYWIICNILDADTKKPHENCSRSRLLTLQKELAKTWKGGNLYVGAEPEAFFVKERKNVGNDGGNNSNYFNPKDPKAFIVTEIIDVLSSMDYKIERGHTEVGENQFEINWEFDKAERTADRIQMYKLICHKVARNYGFDVTFLPKPYPSRNGSGMHCHLSVGNEKTNLFYDAKSKQMNFSEKALQFMTGILENSRAMAAISNSTEVSYSRLVPGYEAPCIIAIGSCNRSASCRVPAIADQAVCKKAIRAEFRFPDPLANPYLLSAAFIIAGLDGIVKKSKFKGFTDDNLYEYGLDEVKKKGFDLLPRNLWEAYREFTKSKMFREKLGKIMHTTYAELILDEINTCQRYPNTESVRKHYFA